MLNVDPYRLCLNQQFEIPNAAGSQGSYAWYQTVWAAPSSERAKG